MKLKILKDTSLSLRSKAKPVVLPLSEKDEKLILRMLEYLKNSQNPAYREKHKNIREGVGLAAPQVGVNKRMLVIHYKDKDDKEITHALVNPQIVENSVQQTYLINGEGCLSVDIFHEGYVPRDYKIVVKAYDAIKKEDVTIKAYEYESIILQHEIDHLNGILYYDRINKMNPFSKIANAVEIG